MPHSRPDSADRDSDPASAPSLGAVEVAPGLTVAREALRFSASRSGGPGGQNVNTRATKVELRVRIADLPLAPAAAARLARLAGRRLLLADDDRAAELLIISDEHRTQARNRDACLDRLRELLLRALPEPKVRRKTRPSRASRARRLDAKRLAGEKKSRRRTPPGED